jgi:hypothetical protein
MFKFQQYHAGAIERGELVKGSTRAEESRKFKTWRDCFVLLTHDEVGFTEDCDGPVHIAEGYRPRGPAAEEERVLRCLGAALIRQWNALPTMLQREIFDTAGSVGRLLETAALRGQIARLLHKHNKEAGRDKLPSAEATLSDARWGAAALSRWDNEGGAIRDEPSI